MNFDYYENIKQLIETDELDKAILFSENELKKLPETDFHKLIDWDITVIAETVCERINLFYDYASKDLEKVDALYCEMNGFTIISKDDDFEKIVLLRKAPPKLIYLKTYNLDTKKLIDLIIKNKDKIVEFDNSKENDIFEIYSN